MKIELKKQYQILLNKAKTDIAVSNLLFNTKSKEIDQEVILFHLQQATEKLIKSLLIFNNIEFPRTHDIEKLVKLTQLNKINLIDNISELEYLSDFAVAGRYEIIVEELDEIEEVFNLVNQLFENIKWQVTNNEIE